MVADITTIAGSATVGVASRRVSISMSAANQIFTINAGNATPIVRATVQALGHHNSSKDRGIAPTSEGTSRRDIGAVPGIR